MAFLRKIAATENARRALPKASHVGDLRITFVASEMKENEDE